MTNTSLTNTLLSILMMTTMATGCSGEDSGGPATNPETNDSGSEPPAANAPVLSIVDVAVHDQAAFGEYVAGHMPTIAQYGGEFVVAAGEFEVIEGAWMPRTLVVHQWPDAETFHRWYDSDEYRPWKELRHSASDANVILVEALHTSVLPQDQAPAFSIVDVAIHDQAEFGRYVEGHMPTVPAYGGDFVVAAGVFEVIEGDWTPSTVVVHQWPSMDAFHTWYDSEEYAPWKEVRHQASSADVVLVQGLSEAAKTEAQMP